MICPKCKKQETSIVKELYESSTNTVKRQRECKCGNLFVTYEMDKLGLKSKPTKILKNTLQAKKKRKPTTKEEWLDFRVFLYGFMRMRIIIKVAMRAMKEYEEKKFKVDDNTFFGPMKYPNKKSYFIVYNRKKDSDFVDVQLEGVKQTIKNCLDLKIYWDKRKRFLKDKITPKKDDARAYSDEAQAYFRSITSNVKNAQYNNIFYSDNKYFDEILSVLEIEKDKEMLRQEFFNSRNWLWYQQAR